MCSKNEDTKSESNSQLAIIALSLPVNCVQRTKIQNLKAIHNLVQIQAVLYSLCSKNEDTKSESNSQLYGGSIPPALYCVQRTKIQNLKAIHNLAKRFKRTSRLCSKNEDTKSESNSQHHLFSFIFHSYCVQRTKIQNLKAIHNKPSLRRTVLAIVFKERRYKIWKQFTTTQAFARIRKYCVQRTKIQNLKAIHNQVIGYKSFDIIVFKERRYKIWKQFTTKSLVIRVSISLCSKNEDTKSESNSQQSCLYRLWGFHCVQRTKIQNLKAIHNW